MKLPFKYTLLIVLLLALATYFLTPLGPKLRGYAGRIWYKNEVALKNDKQVPENTFDWELTDTDGNLHRFKIEKGQVVFLNFWATWCGPCIKEMPDIQKLYDAYGDKVGFLLVTQEDSTKVNAFIAKKGYRLPVYYASTDIPKIFFSKTLPTTYILDKSGTIIRAETGATDWNSEEIRSLLDRLLQK